MRKRKLGIFLPFLNSPQFVLAPFNSDLLHLLVDRWLDINIAAGIPLLNICQCHSLFDIEHYNWAAVLRHSDFPLPNSLLQFSCFVNWNLEFNFSACNSPAAWFLQASELKSLQSSTNYNLTQLIPAGWWSWGREEVNILIKPVKCGWEEVIPLPFNYWKSFQTYKKAQHFYAVYVNAK